MVWFTLGFNTDSRLGVEVVQNVRSQDPLKIPPLSICKLAMIYSPEK